MARERIAGFLVGIGIGFVLGALMKEREGASKSPSPPSAEQTFLFRENVFHEPALR